MPLRLFCKGKEIRPFSTAGKEIQFETRYHNNVLICPISKVVGCIGVKSLEMYPPLLTNEPKWHPQEL